MLVKFFFKNLSEVNNDIGLNLKVWIDRLVTVSVTYIVLHLMFAVREKYLLCGICATDIYEGTKLT